MFDTDMVIFQETKDESLVGDFYSKGYRSPIRDEAQDWSLMNTTYGEANVTMVANRDRLVPY